MRPDRRWPARLLAALAAAALLAACTVRFEPVPADDQTAPEAGTEEDVSSEEGRGGVQLEEPATPGDRDETADDDPGRARAADAAGDEEETAEEDADEEDAVVVDNLPPGLYCADLDDRGASYADAVEYWHLEGRPDRMDASRNGVPCQTVYPASEVDDFWGDS